MGVSSSGSSIKAGTVAWFAANAAPSGFIKANGAAISRSAYAALFAAIGTSYGAGDGSTTFNVPDLRGEFIRAFDDGRGVDSGRGIASWQGQDIQPHSHQYWGYTYTSAAPGGGTPLASNYRTTSMGNTDNAGTTETRPRNVALLACIKY